MKKIILFILLVVSSASYSQTKEKFIFDCDDLNAIFSNPDFANIYVAKMKDTVIFVDTFRVFRCSKLFINGQPVVFLNKFPEEISHGDESSFFIHQARQAKPSEKRYIVVNYLKKETKQRYTLSFWQPENNHAWSIYLFKRKKTSIKIYRKGLY